MNRHVLGRIVKKLAPVSVVGIFDYDGAHEIFKNLMVNVQEAKAAYAQKVGNLLVADFLSQNLRVTFFSICFWLQNKTRKLSENKIGYVGNFRQIISIIINAACSHYP